MTFNDLIFEIKIFEGFRSNAYQDAGRGVWTIGFGRTMNVKPGDVTTQEKEEEYLQKTVKAIYEKVDFMLSKWGYQTTLNQRLVLTDFVYNCGLANLTNLTKDGKRSLSEIREALLLYTKAGSKELPGLVKRRKWEYDNFESKEDRIKKLQQFINNSKLYNGRPLEVDGVIGSKTLDAIESIFYNL